MISLQRLCYLFLATCAAFAVHVVFSDIQSVWFALSVLLFSLLTIGNSFSRRLIIIAITGVAVMASIFVTSYLGAYYLFLALFLFIYSAILLFLAQKVDEWLLPVCLIMTLTMLSITVKTDQFFLSAIIWIVVAVLFILSLQLIFAYRFSLTEWREWLILSLRHMNKMNNDLFACLLNAEYSKNFYLFEHRIHAQKIKSLQSLAHLRKFHQEIKHSKLNKTSAAHIFNKMDQLFNALLDCGQLRFRITDFTTFNICHNELDEILKEIEHSFARLLEIAHGKRKVIKPAMLEDKIQNLEMNYVNVLQVASREPIVFLLFIAGLRSLSQLLVVLQDELVDTISNGRKK